MLQKEQDVAVKNKLYNIIPSGEITIKNVEFPVLGINNKMFKK
jgi:hypothetical protein